MALYKVSESDIVVWSCSDFAVRREVAVTLPEIVGMTGGQGRFSTTDFCDKRFPHKSNPLGGSDVARLFDGL